MLTSRQRAICTLFTIPTLQCYPEKTKSSSVVYRYRDSVSTGVTHTGISILPQKDSVWRPLIREAGL